MLRKYPRLMLLTLLLLLALPFVIAPGCGGGGGGGPAPDTNEVTLSDDAVVIPNDGSVIVEGQTTDEVVLSGDVPPLSPGDILLSTIGEGFLRKIESVHVSAADVGPAQVQIQTSPATLEEAIEDADIHFSQALGAEDFTSAEPLLEGVVVPQVGPAASPSAGPLVVDINATLLDQGGGTVTLTGSISFTPTVIFNLDVSDFYLNSLESALRVDMQSDLTLDAKVTGSLQKEVPLAQFYGAPIPVPPTPIILVPKLTVVVGLEGEVTVGIETGFEFEGWAKAGLAYADGSWTPSTGVGHNFTFYPPSPYIEASLKAYGGIKESLLIMGVAGPYVYQHAYAEVVAELYSGESVVVGDAWIGLEAGAGVHVDILGWELVDYELPYVLDIVPRMKPPGCPNNCHWEADMSAPSVNLTADPPEIYSGESSTLEWYSTNATSVVDSNFGATDVNGSKVVWPTSTTPYLITVEGPGGQASDGATVTVSGHEPPYPPSKPTGPSGGTPGSTLSYSTSTTDPDGDQIKYQYDWGDGSSEWTGYHNSGEPVSAGHAYASSGEYDIRVRAQDTSGLQSDWSPALTITINAAPVQPETPQGPSLGEVGQSLPYFTNTSDPDGDSVKYQFDWGDGTPLQWGEWRPSDGGEYQSHAYSNAGTYDIKVRAKDVHGARSSWSSTHQVEIIVISY